MRNIKCVICSLLVLLILGFVLTGCTEPVPSGSLTTGDNNTVSVPETENGPQIEAVAYNRDISVVYYKNSTWKVKDVSVTENSADVLEYALYKRTLSVEEKYSVRFIPTELAGSKIISSVETNAAAGDIVYDIIMPQMSDSMKLAVKDLLLNVNTLEYNDYSKPWWNNGVMETISVNGINYFAMGDMNLSDYDGTPIVLFNKDVITEFHLESPYKVVRSGEWTIDRMAELSQGITTDLNSDGIMDERDRYGISTNNFAVDILVYGSDIQFAKNNGNGSISFSIDEEKMVNLMEKLNSLLSDNNTYLADRYGSNNAVREENTRSIFAENRALFFPSLLQAVSVMRSGSNEFGILPVPKYNTEQENYVSYVHLYTGTTICIPKYHTETIMLSSLIEDMTYKSHKDVIPVYIEIALKSKHFQDVESGEMLNIVFDSYSCDLANVIRGAGLTLGNDLRDIITKGDSNVASLFASNKRVYEEKFNSIIGSLGD